MVITQLQPITVIFSVAEDYLPQIQQAIAAGHRHGRYGALTARKSSKIATGSLLTLDNQIDTTTGTVKLKAIFPNMDDALFPNQFVNARLLVDTQHDATLVPAAAIQRNGQGAFVYVVKPDQTAEHAHGQGGHHGWKRDCRARIAANAVLAISGFDQLQDGSTVAVRGEGSRGNGQNGAKGAAQGARRRGLLGRPVAVGTVQRMPQPGIPPVARTRTEAKNGSIIMARSSRTEMPPLESVPPFILRPVATSLLMAAILLAGFVAYHATAGFGAAGSGLSDHSGGDVLSRSQPGCDGLGGHRAAGAAVRAGAGLNQMTSTSSGGSSIITLQFALDLNIDVAEQEVQAAINAAQTYLPPDLPTPPIYSKIQSGGRARF